MFLKASCLQVRVFEGCLQTGMPQDFLQGGIGTALGYESGGEGVSEYVRRTLRASKTSSGGKSPYELLDTIDGDMATVRCGKR